MIDLKNDKSWQLVRSLYKTDVGQPFPLVPSQVTLFDCVAKRKAPDGKRNVHIITYTQFGKSDVLAMALTTRASTMPEKWYIVSGSEAKCDIIMGYVRKHIGENEYTKSAFEATGESWDRLRQEKSKKHITFKITSDKFGEIEAVPLNESIKTDPTKAIEKAMGKGSANIVFDESSLVSDDKYAGVVRMIGGHKDYFMAEIGNPFYRNHFYRTSTDPLYYRLVIDYHTGLKEGRITQEQIDRAKKLPFFSVMYECKFPDEGMADAQDWIPLLTQTQIDQAMERKVQVAGTWRMGQDVAEGGCYNVYVRRCDNYAEIHHADKLEDLMKTVDKSRSFMKLDNINPNVYFIDTTDGGGKAVHQRLAQMELYTVSVNFGLEANNKDKYLNRRAELIWQMRDWILQGGALSKDDRWYELQYYKYRASELRKGRIQIMPKIEMKRLARGHTFDFGDALATTFASPISFNMVQENRFLSPNANIEPIDNDYTGGAI